MFDKVPRNIVKAVAEGANMASICKSLQVAIDMTEPDAQEVEVYRQSLEYIKSFGDSGDAVAQKCNGNGAGARNKRSKKK